MLLSLSKHSKESLQSQILRQIRSQILTGSLQPHENLPSIRVLSRQNDISVITVQRVYENLIKEGLILSRKGSGFFICQLTEQEKEEIKVKLLEDTISLPLRMALDEGLKPGQIMSSVKKCLGQIR